MKGVSMNEPEIRFKGFEGEWKDTTLNDKGIDIYAGGDVDKVKLKTKGKYPVISNGLINDGILGYYENDFRISSPSVTVVGRGSNTGYAQPRLFSYTPVVRLLSIKSFHDVYFLASVINKKSFNVELAGLPQLTTKELAEFKITFPNNLAEENKIGSYLKYLDSISHKIKTKISFLKQTKAACLQSMFPKEGETVPKVRFKGFEGEWEEKRLNECIEISSEKNTENAYGIEDVLSVSDEFGVQNQIELLGRSFAGKSLVNYSVLHKGQIVYTKSPLKSKPYGIVKENTYDTGIVSVLYGVYYAKEKCSISYIHYYFDPAWRLNTYVKPLVNKGAKNTMNISDAAFLEGTILIPSLAEQQKIASFFQSLDKKISLETLRLEKLKHIKAACLDKMFV